MDSLQVNSDEVISTAWTGRMRGMLWTEEHWDENERCRALRAPDPQLLPPDRYRIRVYWPTILEALRLMTPTLL